jgi:hypothetical protein
VLRACDRHRSGLSFWFIVLVYGVVVGQPFATLAATAGAFSVGFGLCQRLTSFTVAPMLLALVGMTISTTIGTLASASPLWHRRGHLRVRGGGGSGARHRGVVDCTAMVIALVIAAAFPADPTFALVRITVTRIIGTMAGAGVATLIFSVLRPSQTILVALIAVMAWGCYASLRVNYARFSMLITGYIALLFAFGVCQSRPWHCIGSLPLRSAAVSRFGAHFLYVAHPPRRGAAISAPPLRS